MRKIRIIFIALCMIACLVPFVGMAFHPTEGSTENRVLKEFPSLTTGEGTLNTEFFREFDSWFNEHFAFRNELVAADSRIQGAVFGVSAQDQVIYGTDGWLYYASTLGDYLGTNCMNEREKFNLKHNLEILHTWTKEQGVELLLTVPPNKNTLYGEHMPYYDSLIVDEGHTLDDLSDICSEIGLPYADLYTRFREEEEILYLKRDSHWNGEGALLAYNCIMEKAAELSEDDGSRSVALEYRDYSDAEAVRARDADGDLNRMMYTYYGEKEMDTRYQTEPQFTYVTDTKSVEDAWIKTSVEGKEGTLLMFRDSFGNTLLPYMADQFGSATFSKESPYRLQKLVSEERPELLIIEKVERNLRDFITEPPILAAPEWKDDTIDGLKLSETDAVDADTVGFTIREDPFDPSMDRIFGEVPEELLSGETEILLQIDGKVVRTYHTGTNGFMVYLEHEYNTGQTEEGYHLRLILKDGESYRVVCDNKEG